MNRRLLAFAFALPLSVVTSASCGGGDAAQITGGDDGGPKGGDDGSILGGGESGAFGDAVALDDALVGCATNTQRGQQLPLDIAMMIDTSGSMFERVATGETKMEAVRNAMGNFTSDPGSSGISVGLQHFPIFSNAPNACTATAQCTSPGQWVLKGCVSGGGGPNKQVTLCLPGDICTGGASCVALGQCHNEGEFKCVPGNSCGTLTTANGPFDLGNCDPMTESFCNNEQLSCTLSDYTTEAVPFAMLNGAAPTIMSWVGGLMPNSVTPTGVALSGAVAAAKARASANPTHTVAVVLVTDGIPSAVGTAQGDVPAACQPDSTSVAASGMPDIKTFVIGVFSPADITAGQPFVNSVAQAGGTSTAFVIDTSSNVSQGFLQALNSIRGSALPCEYALPVPEAGTPDFGKVNVQYTPSSGSAVTTLYVETAANCDTTQGGWYYDADPTTGATPTRIEMCPATCARLKADTGGRVDVVQGCKTIIQVH
jgi:hypothetical protein